MKRTIATLLLTGAIIAMTGSAGTAGDDAGARQAAGDIAADASKQLTTRVYDVRSLIAPIPDFPLEGSLHGQAFASAPGDAPAATGFASGGATTQVGNTLFGGGIANVQETADERQNVEWLAKLITDTIDADSWKDNGGAIGIMRQLHGALIITQTGQNQNAIATFLRQLAQDQGVVRVTADWLLLPPAELARLIKPATGERPNASPQVIDPAALEKLDRGVRHFHAETLGFSAQTVHVVSGRERTLVSNTTPVISTKSVGYAPTMANVGNGLALEVNPRVDADHKTALVTVYSTFTVPHNVTGLSASGAATTRPVDGEQVVRGRTTAMIQPVAQVVQELRTSVRVPIGVPVVVGGMTLEPNSQSGDPSQLVLILTITAAK